MPYGWVEPEKFMEYKGVEVYHCYKDDDIEWPLQYWYTTDNCGVEVDDNFRFDVREIESELEKKGFLPDEIVVEEDDENEHAPIIRCAIDHGMIKVPGE